MRTPKQALTLAGVTVFLITGWHLTRQDGTAGAVGGGAAKQSAKLLRSTALTQAPEPQRGPLEPSYTAAQARSAAAGRAEALPLPDGGNVNGVRWEEAGGVVRDSEMQAVLQYNAACQWLRAASDGREPLVAQRVFSQAGDWPALRGTPAAEVLRAASADDGGPVSAGVLADCDASHEREVQYALERGLPAPS